MGSLSARYLCQCILVIRCKKIGNGNFFGTYLCTIFALSARNLIVFANDFANAVGSLEFFLVQRDKRIHGIDIRLHHIHIPHSRKNHKHLGVACGITKRIGNGRGIANFLEFGNRLCGKIYKSTTLNRLHNNDFFAVLNSYIVASLALNAGIIIVEIVDLQLNHLNLRLFGKNLIQNIRRIVERHSNVAYFALFVQLVNNLKGVALFVFGIGKTLECMEKIKVKILYAANFELLLEQRTNLFFFFKKPIGKLICQNIFISWITRR